MSLEMIDSDAIIDARVRGESARSISRRLGVSLDDIFDVLDRWATQTITHKLRFHTLALELARLDEMQKVFDAQARTGDVASGALVAKLGEQRRILLGGPGAFGSEYDRRAGRTGEDLDLAHRGSDQSSLPRGADEAEC
jgi:hypothetical protein